MKGFIIYTLSNSFMFLMIGGCFEKFIKRNVYVKSLPPYEKRLYIGNFISLIHSIIISTEGTLCLTNPSRDPRKYLPIMTGYFLLDTFVQGKLKSLITLHHIIGFILNYLSYICKEKYIIFKLIPYFMLSEISTIFLCFGILLNGTKKYPIKNKSKRIIFAKNITFVVFVFSFFLTRILILPYKVYEMYRFHSKDLKEFGGIYSEVCIFSLLFLQVYWYRLILRIVIKNIKTS